MQSCLLRGPFSLPQDLSYLGLWLLRLFAGDDSSGRSQARLQQPTTPSSSRVSERAWPHSAEGLWVLNNGVTRREDARDPLPAWICSHDSLGGMRWLPVDVVGRLQGPHLAVRSVGIMEAPSRWFGRVSSPPQLQQGAEPCAGRRVKQGCIWAGVFFPKCKPQTLWGGEQLGTVSAVLLSLSQPTLPVLLRPPPQLLAASHPTSCPWGQDHLCSRSWLEPRGAVVVADGPQGSSLWE